MARKVFYSFHYQNDHWRVQQVMKMGVIEGQPLLSSQRWEEVQKAGKAAIEAWIAQQMKDKSVVVVLIGSETSTRPWVRHEIIKAWNDGKGLLGVYIHGLKDEHGYASLKGKNPFDGVKMKDGTLMSKYVSVYEPIGSTSQDKYDYIKRGLPNWVEAAYQKRNR